MPFRHCVATATRWCGNHCSAERTVIDDMKLRPTVTGCSRCVPCLARVLLALSAVTLAERFALGASVAAATAAAQDMKYQVRGSAESTVIALQPTGSATIHLEAAQVGHLSHFGHFTGEFSYDAELYADEIVLQGTATLTNDKGEQLFLTADIIETGTAEPLDVTGTLTITGGTGRFAGASGSLAVTGVDDVSLVDTIYLAGTIVTQGD